MITVSKMTGKLEHLSAINTNPLTNKFCQKMAKCDKNICHKCYSMRMLKTSRQNCAPGWEANGEELSSGPLTQVPVIVNTMCRFHAHGELINKQHYENLCVIAEKNPRTTFSLFTKRKDLVDPARAPHNMVLVYSNPKLDSIQQVPPEGFDTVFNVVTEGPHNCQMSCYNCGMCYVKGGTRCIIERIK